MKKNGLYKKGATSAQKKKKIQNVCNKILDSQKMRGDP